MRKLSGYARHRGVATLATLQPGIEPATLTLLALNHVCRPDHFGWIVGAGQAGMAIGAALCWRLDKLAGRNAALGAAATGVIGSLSLALSHDLISALFLRFILGVAMGVLLTRATAQAARYRPHHAIGTMLLAQQILSTAVMAALPIAGVAWGATAALATLAAGPLAMILLIGSDDAPVLPAAAGASAGEHAHVTAIRTGARRAMALVFGITMLAWSYMEVVGEELDLAPRVIGLTIAIASLGSIPAGLLASLRPPRYAPSLTLLVAGSGIVAPLLIPDESDLWIYGAAMTLFNAGSTFAMIRCLAWAMEGREADADRRGVLMVQCVAMGIGPAIGALTMSAGGLPAIALVSSIGLVGAVTAMLPDLTGRVVESLRKTRQAAQLESDRLWGPSLTVPRTI